MKTTVRTPNDTDVVIERAFDAPRDAVFDALTRPELLRQWYGPEGWTLETCEVDLRVGGRWRFVSRKPDGKRIGQKGVYIEIVPGRRIVNTESWEDWDTGETTVTVVLEERDGRTFLTNTIRFPSKAIRDEVLRAGMTRDVEEVYGRLEALVCGHNS